VHGRAVDARGGSARDQPREGATNHNPRHRPRDASGPASATVHDVAGVTHHSDKGVQYLAVRYTQRLAEAGAVASVGTTGDSYDALAEAFNSLFKAELIRNRGPWKSIDDLEIAVAEYVDWFNHRRLHGEIGMVPPAEHEDDYYRRNPAPTTVGASTRPTAVPPDRQQSLLPICPLDGAHLKVPRPAH
jgi:transposase InsO family protein